LWRLWAAEKWIPLVGCVLGLLYGLGKRFGANSLFDVAEYRPTFTWSQLWDRQTEYLNVWFYRWPVFTPHRTMALYLVLLCIAAISKSARVRIALSIALVGTLPITFVNGRFGNCTYLPMFGWCLLIGCAFVWLADSGRLPILVQT